MAISVVVDMLGWTIHKDKPQGWQGEHILACYMYCGSKLEEPKKCYFMYCDVLKRTKSGTLKIRIYGERWKKVTGKPRIKYLKLEDQNRVKSYKRYYDDGALSEIDNLPAIKSVWQHYNGNKYRVIAIANEFSRNKDLYPVTVVYENVHTGSIWCKPLDDFIAKLKKV